MPLYFADYTHRKVEIDPVIAKMRFSVEAAQAGSDPDARTEVGVTPPFDVRARLGEIKVPTLIVVGRRDFVCSLKMARIIHAGIAGSQLTVLEHSGHIGHFEEPEAFARAVGDYVLAAFR